MIRRNKASLYQRQMRVYNSKRQGTCCERIVVVCTGCSRHAPFTSARLVHEKLEIHALFALPEGTRSKGPLVEEEELRVCVCMCLARNAPASTSLVVNTRLKLDTANPTLLFLNSSSSGGSGNLLTGFGIAAHELELGQQSLKTVGISVRALSQ